VFPRQGHYATDMRILTEYPAADISIDSIGELARSELSEFVGVISPASPSRQ
jgi:hypothetical protein